MTIKELKKENFFDYYTNIVMMSMFSNELDKSLNLILKLIKII